MQHDTRIRNTNYAIILLRVTDQWWDLLGKEVKMGRIQQQLMLQVELPGFSCPRQPTERSQIDPSWQAQERIRASSIRETAYR